MPPGTAAAVDRAYVIPGATAPVFSALVPAGFPSPADDHLEGQLDLHQLMVQRPASTFFARADGESMMPDIHSGDLLVVDRSLQAQDGDIVVATLDGGLTVKRLRKTAEGWALASDNTAFPTFPIDPEQGVQVWGVVTYSVVGSAIR